MAMTALARLKRDALRWSVTIHRWTGVVTCLFFLVWFLTGAVMAFVPFPDLSKGQRLALAERVEPALVRLSPAQAFGTDAVRLKGLKLVQVAGHPVYLGATADGPLPARSAVTGEAIGLFSLEEARVVAEHTGGAPAVSVAGPLPYDQWIVNASYNAGRPFYRVRMDDAARTDLYVASRTGEVMQRTTAFERGWAWVGSIPHWAYYTVLGQHRLLWNQVCFYGSAFAFAVAVLGMILGVERWLAVRRAKRISPFPERWMRWHHLTGLFAGILVLTWMGSGVLSNDNHRLFSGSTPSADAKARYTGSFDPVALAHGPDARFAGATEVGYASVGGKTWLVGRGGALTAPVIVDAASGVPAAAIPMDQISAAVAAGWPGASAPSAVPPGDFYAKAEGMPANTLRFDAADKVRVYVDRDTGAIAAVMDRSRRALAWLYYGLHTLQLPGLIGHDTLRRPLECVLLLIGATVAATGVVIGWTRLRQTVAA